MYLERTEKRVKVERNYLPPTDLILKKGGAEKSSKEDCGTREFAFLVLRQE